MDGLVRPLQNELVVLAYSHERRSPLQVRVQPYRVVRGSGNLDDAQGHVFHYRLLQARLA